jgi:glutaredoxin
MVNRQATSFRQKDGVFEKKTAFSESTRSASIHIVFINLRWIESNSQKSHLRLCMELIVYSAPWCCDCREAKRFLDRNKISYTEINIETTPGAAEDVIRNSGKRAIPQFVIDGKWVQPYRVGHGFLYEEMSALLGIDA